jgi:hypothetical protein
MPLTGHRKIDGIQHFFMLSRARRGQSCAPGPPGPGTKGARVPAAPARQ